MKRKQYLGKNNIISLKEDNGTHVHDQDRMIGRCEELYTNLYSTKPPQGQPSVQIHNTRNTPPPPILPADVSAAIKRLQRNKAPGNDNITTEDVKDGGEPIGQMFTNMFNRCELPNSWKARHPDPVSALKSPKTTHASLLATVLMVLSS